MVLDSYPTSQSGAGYDHAHPQCLSSPFAGRIIVNFIESTGLDGAYLEGSMMALRPDSAT